MYLEILISWLQSLGVLPLRPTVFDSGGRLLADTDNAKTFTFASSLYPYAATIDSGLPENFQATFIQIDTQALAFVPNPGVTLLNAHGHNGTLAKGAVVKLMQIAPDTYVLTGDTALVTL